MCQSVGLWEREPLPNRPCQRQTSYSEALAQTTTTNTNNSGQESRNWEGPVTAPLRPRQPLPCSPASVLQPGMPPTSADPQAAPRTWSHSSHSRLRLLHLLLCAVLVCGNPVLTASQHQPRRRAHPRDAAEAREVPPDDVPHFALSHLSWWACTTTSSEVVPHHRADVRCEGCTSPHRAGQRNPSPDQPSSVLRAVWKGHAGVAIQLSLAAPRPGDDTRWV